jgi:hypothetical protein
MVRIQNDAKRMSSLGDRLCVMGGQLNVVRSWRLSQRAHTKCLPEVGMLHRDNRCLRIGRSGAAQFEGFQCCG